MNLLVTGGTGFFGKALIRYWKDTGFFTNWEKVYILTRNPELVSKNHRGLFDIENMELVYGDLNNQCTLPQDIKFTHMIHAATESTNGPYIDALVRYLDIHNGLLNAVNMGKRSGMTRMLLVSSGGVYGGRSPKSGFGEDSAFNLDTMWKESAYSLGKVSAEHMAAQLSQQYDFELVVARCFSFVGIDLPLDAHFAIGNFLRDALNDRDIIVKGDGLAIRSYMNQWDLAEWLSHILIKGQNLNVYNVGSDMPISIKELAELVSACAYGTKNRVLVENQVDNSQSSHRNAYLPNISKAKQDLGLRVKFCVKESLLEILNKRDCKV